MLSRYNDEIQNYLKILCSDYPLWLDDYINTPEMMRIDEICIGCGTDYSGIYNPPYFYSNLTHSIGVALIVWNFTKSKEATLAGLFHDIATPVFKHCIDFMNGDSETQESTEMRTVEILKNSVEINKLLDRDGISIDLVCDYKMYPIADNDTPNLSADRLEYTFSSGMTLKKVWDLDAIKKVYDNLVVDVNEVGCEELVFKDLSVATYYVDIISSLWPSWIDDNDRTVMQFIADITKKMLDCGYLCVDDLYSLSEAVVIEKIKTCDNDEIRCAFLNFENCLEAFKCDSYIPGKYCVYTKGKTRYINPYVFKKNRVSKLSFQSNSQIQNYLSLPKEGWTYFDFEFDGDKL